MCVDRLLDCLDKMAIIDDVLPFLADIQTTDVNVIMPLVSQYRSFSRRISFVGYCLNIDSKKSRLDLDKIRTLEGTLKSRRVRFRT